MFTKATTNIVNLPALKRTYSNVKPPNKNNDNLLMLGIGITATILISNSPPPSSGNYPMYLRKY